MNWGAVTVVIGAVALGVASPPLGVVFIIFAVALWRSS